MATPKRIREYCAVYGCFNKTSKDVRFFAVPKNTERRREWLIAMGREELIEKNINPKNILICSAHFEESDMIIFKRLDSDAAPTKLLPFSGATITKRSKKEIDKEPKVARTIATQTVPNKTLIKNKTTQTPIDKPENEHGKRKRRRLDQESEESEANNSSSLSDSKDIVAERFMKLLECQNKIKSDFKGNRYDDEFKAFAMSLHCVSPPTYTFLKKVLKLPSKNTINRLRSKIPSKINDRVLQSLSLKVSSLPANARYCTICLNKIALKRSLFYDIKKDDVIGFHDVNGSMSPEIASYAYVILLQGTYCNWTQPVAYVYSGSNCPHADLDLWINEVILKLFGIGIEVKGIVTDEESDFDQYAKVIKGVTAEKPYFFVNDLKIFYIFDVPHLLKCMRNNLLSNDFYHEENKISWDDLNALFEFQKVKDVKLIPKITTAHIVPNNSQKLELNYAAQIFSNAVYAALETYIDFGQISEGARGTAKFIKLMDELFDVLNSSTKKSVKKNKCGFEMTADQKMILQNAINLFANIKVINRETGHDITTQISTFENFQITIKSIFGLFEDMRHEGFNYLLTRRLNQECVELLFSTIRSEVGINVTPIIFVRIFSRTFLKSLVESDKANREPDLHEILLKVERMIAHESANPPDRTKTSLLALCDDDYRIDLPETKPITYIAGFLLHKCSIQHKDCKELLKAVQSLTLNLNNYDYYKEFNKDKQFYGNIMEPCQEFIEYVTKLEEIFANNFVHHVQGNPGIEIFELFKEIHTPTLPCSCFPIEFMLSLFVRLRIFTTIKFNNEYLKTRRARTSQYIKVKQI